MNYTTDTVHALHVGANTETWWQADIDWDLPWYQWELTRIGGWVTLVHEGELRTEPLIHWGPALEPLSVIRRDPDVLTPVLVQADTREDAESQLRRIEATGRNLRRETA